MVLRRVGAKHKLAHKIIEHFPRHDIYIEMFFGAGGIYFNKPEANYNFLNDNDEEVYNLFKVLKTDSKVLENEIELIPYHEKIFKEFMKYIPENPVMKAVRFLYLSNFSYMGKSDTLRLISAHSKKQLLKNIEITLKKIQNCQFLCCDFREVLNKISLDKNNKHNIFIYADPPYLSATNNYQSGFTESDTQDLFRILVESKIKFAISEFKNEYIINLANQYKLNVIDICERRTLNNRNTEILITNYKNGYNLF